MNNQENYELGKLAGWKEEGGYLRKVYAFEDWKDITKFLKNITDLVVELNHHPELHLSSKNRKAKVSLRSHNQNSITEYDIDFATKLDKKTDNEIGMTDRIAAKAIRVSS